MGNIVLLDDLTINKIAAGEVIERPANVVKELVENAIDAGANKITIEAKSGGKSYIKITDNGKGIPRDEMNIALERHATSKLRKVEDLEKIYTMGFRGEALASIAAISKLTMLSKTQDEEFGTKLITEAGEVIDFQECGLQTGTTIIVENLFFNTPVRYKFLKQDKTESRYIKEWVEKASLSNPDVAIKLVIDNKVILNTSGNGKIRDVIYMLYGKDITNNIVPVDYIEDSIKVTGVIGNTLISQDTRKNQIIFLNRRNIKNPTISNSIDQALKGSIGIGKYGFGIINLKMPANYYDVNVHPTKIEVRFNKEDVIYRVIFNAIKNAILKTDFLGNKQVESNNQKYIESEYKFQTNTLEKQEKNELTKRENKRKVEYKYIGISFKTYIMIEIENKIFLIDQHAAHERVLYEKIKQNYKNNIAHNVQMMLIPQVFNLSHKEMEFVVNNIDLFRNVGFDIQIFGENSVKINGIPDLEYKAKSKNIFLDILDEMISDKRTSIKDVEERFIATVACKAAVKANMDLQKEEVDNLVKSLLVLNNPYTCPHGRPTTIRIRPFGTGYF